MNLAQHLHDTGRKYPDRPALGFGTAIVSNYAMLAKRVARLASALRDECDLAVGDRVAIVSSNTPEYLEALYAIWHAGCVGVPANAKLHGAELAYILEQSGARVCFASSDLVPAIEAHALASLERIIVLGSSSYETLLTADAIDVAERQPGDIAWLFYTSGTTGKPKGAMLSHCNLATMACAYQDQVDPIRLGDPLLHAAPMSHGSGLYIIPYIINGGVNVVPESGGFDPAEIFKLIEAWPRTSMFAAPTMVKRLIEHSGDCRAENIRTIIWGGAPMYVEDAVRALDRFGPRFAQIYGQGESPMTITVLSRDDIADRRNPHWRERLASAGRAFSCVDVIIADDNGQVVPQGVAGEILVRGDPVMTGYWQNEEASVAALRDGHLHTGEVEEVLLRHPGVREVSVIGRPDREWGEAVVAYVVGEASPADLDTLCINTIARFKRPKKYVFVDALPKNNYGKVLKTVLRERDSDQP